MIGTALSRETLRVVDWKPMAQGILLWLVITADSLPVIMREVH